MNLGIAKLVLYLAVLVAGPPPSSQVARLSVDTGECGGPVSAHITVARSAVLTGGSQASRAYGLISYQRTSADAARKQCHVVYRLFVSNQNHDFGEAKRLEWDTEEGQIAGIDLIGFSSNGGQLAADFWRAEGDSWEHGPVIYNISSKKAVYKPLDDRIQKQINGCDQVEDFVGVTDDGQAIFSVPPSTYEDSPECGDKGVWHFNLSTGEVRQVAKVSGDKWK